MSETYLPARSTRCILLTISLGRPSLKVAWVNFMVKMAWERLLASFILVAAVTLEDKQNSFIKQTMAEGGDSKLNANLVHGCDYTNCSQCSMDKSQ